MKIYGEKWASRIVIQYEKSDPRVRAAIDQFIEWELGQGHWETPDKAHWFIRTQMTAALCCSAGNNRWETFKRSITNKINWQIAYNTVVRTTGGKVVNNWVQNTLTFV